MRLGILTFHFACNYGALLQCYALQHFLGMRGHQVDIIDYRPDIIARGYKVFDIRRFWGSTPSRFIRKTRTELSVISDRKRRYETFDTFVNNKLNLSTRIKSVKDIEKICNSYDVLIVGSDQVWNPKICGGIDPLYWARFEHNGTKLISYAASMENDFSADLINAVKNYLPVFDALSVREASLTEKIKSILPDQEVWTVADPTLLLTGEQWTELASAPPKKDDYLLFYQVRNCPQAYETAKKLAESKGLRFLCLSAKPELQNSPEIISSSPEEFVGLFRHAAYVVTTSFHGTVFSILFRKDFVCIDVQDGKGSRQKNLLERFNLSDRIITSDLSDIPDMQWDRVESALVELRRNSEDYLNHCGL